MNIQLRRILVTAALLSLGPAALKASGGGSSSGSSSSGGSSPGRLQVEAVDRYAPARRYIAAQKWPEAIEELQKTADPKSADWNNLMGFCARRSEPPDLAAAERYYMAALAINPKHLGTLEYLGEMRLQQGNLAGAEQALTSLRKATFLKSAEYKELQHAIAQYHAAGNRYVPEE